MHSERVPKEREAREERGEIIAPGTPSPGRLNLKTAPRAIGKPKAYLFLLILLIFRK
jgi:hypothetical protein